jgi:hypothetical protein
MRKLIGLVVLAVATGGLWAQRIPPGTLLPVMLDNSFDSDKGKPGDAISAILRQDVPLHGGSKIKR